MDKCFRNHICPGTYMWKIFLPSIIIILLKCLLQVCSEQIGNLKDEEGRIIADPSGKANLMNAFFSSVFTQEEIINMPDFEPRPYANTSRIYKHHSRQSELAKLNPSKSPGPDKMHPSTQGNAPSTSRTNSTTLP